MIGLLGSLIDKIASPPKPTAEQRQAWIKEMKKKNPKFDPTDKNPPTIWSKAKKAISDAFTLKYHTLVLKNGTKIGFKSMSEAKIKEYRTQKATDLFTVDVEKGDAEGIVAIKKGGQYKLEHITIPWDSVDFFYKGPPF